MCCLGPRNESTVELCTPPATYIPLPHTSHRQPCLGLSSQAAGVQEPFQTRPGAEAPVPYEQAINATPRHAMSPLPQHVVNNSGVP